MLRHAEGGRLRVQVGRGAWLSDHTCVESLIDALVLAGDRLAPGSPIAGKPYFITHGEPVPFWEFVKRGLDRMGLPPIRAQVPHQLVYAIAALKEGFEALRGGAASGEDGLTRFAIRSMCTHHCFSIERARDLGYSPRVSVAEGIERTCRHLESERARGTMVKRGSGDARGERVHHGRMPRLAAFVIAALLLAHASARADVVGPPPSDCPEGTSPVTGHCSVCAPESCASDGDCATGERCEERSYCTRVYETCGGWGGPGATDARPFCGAGATCPADAPCTAHRVCVASAGGDGGRDRELVRYDCGCRVGDRGGARLGWLAAIVAIAIGRRARRG